MRIVDHAAQATAAAARLPPPGPREPGGLGALQKAVFKKHLLNENTGRGAEAHRTTPTFLTHRLPHAFLPAFVHSFIRSLSVSWRWPGPAHLRRDPGSPPAELSHVAHI